MSQGVIGLFIVGLLQAPTDTGRPMVPAELNLPNDHPLTVTHPGDSLPVYYRNIVEVAFDDTTSGRTIRKLLRRYAATIIGGAPSVGPHGAYIVRVPDPGATFAALERLVDRLEREPGVAEASWITFRDVIRPRERG